MNSLIDFLPLLIAIAGLATLVTLSVIDLRVWLLPNWLNLVLAFLGICFHASLGFAVLEPIDMVYGAAMGAGLLMTVRFFGNRHYGQDTLGLGDVKLLGAAGLWLGLEGVVIAITVGACAGTFHGIGVALIRAIRERSRPNLKRLMIPAGPGFCVGIAIAFLWKFSGHLLG